MGEGDGAGVEEGVSVGRNRVNRQTDRGSETDRTKEATATGLGRGALHFDR